MVKAEGAVVAGAEEAIATKEAVMVVAPAAMSPARTGTTPISTMIPLAGRTIQGGTTPPVVTTTWARCLAPTAG